LYFVLKLQIGLFFDIGSDKLSIVLAGHFVPALALLTHMLSLDEMFSNVRAPILVVKLRMPS
jgi:hypothetical protein